QARILEADAEILRAYARILEAHAEILRAQ
nr:Chain A, synthetic peptide [synthetic construct]3J89_B Chain B, synthetic peptide [synthetic construct]3J89_C Chain C, synthetic peptide [synthetic construct]3J89_D Chain D, synthetic peptide [synthetic construct]3J89_E Chain E, synthetic peptide [synthetic construct]3J89_F Chain F, synthetic peptide [synthetic construct]3J89_G Chain G, synthetic peptide [synthetic construct]3J89_H Chain H, synthetic peptide [synthetic construct]3J89_I Chain I, synthetic peptide [synthetic construct]3J8